MKKLTAVAAIALLSIGASAFAGQTATTGVIGSKHDITRAGGYKTDDFGRVCIYCHTPHNAVQDNALDPTPLWNRVNPVAGDVTDYTWSAPANVAMGLADDSLKGPSRLCLSCHDGLIAADSHGPAIGTAQGSQGTTKIALSTGRAWTDLTGTHPIGFSFTQAFNKRGPTELVNPVGTLYIDSLINPSTFDTQHRSGSNIKYTGKLISDHLYGDILTCASCHDVHNTNNAVNTTALNGSTAPNYFVWSQETDSVLCLSCHVK